MTLAVRWTTRASDQLRKAALYLEQERTAAGGRLIDGVQAILEVAAKHPDIFPRVPGISGNEVRRGLLRKFGYWVIYQINPGEILVLSIWHGLRRAKGWRKS